jgi:hypothetical protein
MSPSDMDENVARLLASVPADIADELIKAGAAFPVPRLRAGDVSDLDILISLTQVAATVITLVQAPKTIEQLIDLVARRQPASGRAKPGRLVIRARGDHGRVELRLDPDTPAAEIARVIRLVS